MPEGKLVIPRSLDRPISLRPELGYTASQVIAHAGQVSRLANLDLVCPFCGTIRDGACCSICGSTETPITTMAYMNLNNLEAD